MQIQNDFSGIVHLVASWLNILRMKKLLNILFLCIHLIGNYRNFQEIIYTFQRASQAQCNNFCFAPTTNKCLRILGKAIIIIGAEIKNQFQHKCPPRFSFQNVFSFIKTTYVNYELFIAFYFSISLKLCVVMWCSLQASVPCHCGFFPSCLPSVSGPEVSHRVCPIEAKTALLMGSSPL